MARLTRTVGNIRNGVPHIIDQTEKASFYDQFRDWPDCEIEFIVKQLYARKTRSQEKYYRGVVLPMIAAAMSDNLGEDVDEDEAHELLKRKFNLRTIETANGFVKIPGSTKRLSTVEYIAYVEKCRNWAADFFGIDIPDPIKLTTTKSELKV